MNKLTARAIVATPWWIRTAIYVVTGIIGLICVVTGVTTPETVDGWLGQVTGVAALLSGIVAGMHTGKASDETAAEEIARRAGTQPEDTPARPALPVLDATTTAA